MNDDQIEVRVNQIYRAYLDAVFSEEYYRARHDETIGVAQTFDILIAVGAALSGATGIAILQEENFAYACGILTLLSILLSAAKAGYNWSDKLRRSLELEAAYARSRAELSGIVDDIQLRKTWSEELDKEFIAKRDALSNIPSFPFKHSSEDQRRKVQASIKSRIKYEQWWKFKRGN